VLYFPQIAVYIIFFSFSVTNNTFFTNFTLKFQYQPDGIKVECYAKLNLKYPVTEYDDMMCVCVHVHTCVSAHVE
jgi:hypothetical protein